MSDLNPAVKEIVAELAANGAPELNTLSVSQARDQFSDFLDEYLPDESRPPEESLSIAGPNGPITLSVTRPSGAESAPVILWFHGGGWMLGSISSYAPFHRVLAEYTGYTVIGVEYRLAPEHPFPEGLIDCYTALDWVSNTSHRVSTDNQPLAVGGDSAGANLAIAASLMASHRGTAEIDHQILAYPATRFPPSSPTDSNSEYFLTTADVAWFWDNYLQTEIDGYHQYAAPLETRSVSDFPPTTLITAEFDPLRKDGQLLADRLSTEGVTHNYHHYPSMPHGFLTLLGKPHVPIAHQACEQIADELPRE